MRSVVLENNYPWNDYTNVCIVVEDKQLIDGKECYVAVEWFNEEPELFECIISTGSVYEEQIRGCLETKPDYNKRGTMEDQLNSDYAELFKPVLEEALKAVAVYYAS